MQNMVLNQEDSHSDSPRTSVKVRLCCEMCKRRKVKCDKLSPCSNCQRIGAVCSPVERARLPRGRYKVSKDRTSAEGDDLRSRVARLERLVRGLIPGNTDDSANIQQETGTPLARIPERDMSSVPSTILNRSDTLNKLSGTQQRTPLDSEPIAANADGSPVSDSNSGPLLGGSFWADLVQETRGLRQLLERTSKDSLIMDDDPSVDAQLLAFCGQEHLDSRHEKSNTREILGEYFTPQIGLTLYDLYLHQVDPVFKVIHHPSLSAHLLRRERYLDYEHDHPAVEALVSSINYAAVCTTTDERCFAIFGVNKIRVISRYRMATELALARAKLFSTTDVTVLQAFILYLVATRIHDRSRKVWTMLSLAVRIAQALYLHIENPPFFVGTFDREMRRRVWFAISLLDTQACLDRATEPMISASWLKSNLPSKINDSDLEFGFDGQLTEREGYTEMNFTLMVCKAQYVMRIVNSPSSSELAVNDLDVRQKYVDEFRQTASVLLCDIQPDKEPLHWYVKRVAEVISADLQLIAFRPLQRHKNCNPPQVSGSSLLRLAVGIIESSQSTLNDTRIFPWLWLHGIFVQWYALAVAIAEFCVCENRSLVERYWPPIELGFSRYSHFIADSEQGMLWRPIENLMKKARSKVHTLLEFQHLENGPVSNQASSVAAYQEGSGTTSLSFVAAAPQQDMHPIPATGAEQNPSLLLDGSDGWLNTWPTIDVGEIQVDDDFDTAWANWGNFVEELHFGHDSLY